MSTSGARLARRARHMAQRGEKLSRLDQRGGSRTRRSDAERRRHARRVRALLRRIATRRGFSARFSRRTKTNTLPRLPSNRSRRSALPKPFLQGPPGDDVSTEKREILIKHVIDVTKNFN